MDTRNLQLGDWFADQRYGAGMVSFVGHDYVGVRFDDGRDALLRRSMLEEGAPTPAPPGPAGRASLPWPLSTFTDEPQDARHFLGSHWEPTPELTGNDLQGEDS